MSTRRPPSEDRASPARALVALALLAAVLAFATPTARAGFVVFELDKVHTGDTPDGPVTGPWLRARFEDSGTPGQVILTLTSLLQNGNSLKGSDNNVAWAFNLINGKKAEDLNFIGMDGTLVDGSLNGNLADAIIRKTDGVKSAPPEDFDFGFVWDTKDRFEGNDTAVYKITIKSGGLTAADFNVKNTDKDGFYSYAHVQEIGKGSGKIYDGDGGDITDTEVHPTPEPSGLLLAGLGACGLLALRRKYFSRSARP